MSRSDPGVDNIPAILRQTAVFLDNQTRSNAELQQQLQELEYAYQTQQKQLNSIQKDLEASKALNDSLIAENKSLKNLNDSLENKISRLNHQWHVAEKSQIQLFRKLEKAQNANKHVKKNYVKLVKLINGIMAEHIGVHDGFSVDDDDDDEDDEDIDVHQDMINGDYNSKRQGQPFARMGKGHKRQIYGYGNGNGKGNDDPSFGSMKGGSMKGGSKNGPYSAMTKSINKSQESFKEHRSANNSTIEINENDNGLQYLSENDQNPAKDFLKPKLKNLANRTVSFNNSTPTKNNTNTNSGNNNNANKNHSSSNHNGFTVPDLLNMSTSTYSTVSSTNPLESPFAITGRNLPQTLSPSTSLSILNSPLLSYDHRHQQLGRQQPHHSHSSKRQGPTATVKITLAENKNNNNNNSNTENSFHSQQYGNRFRGKVADFVSSFSTSMHISELLDIYKNYLSGFLVDRKDVFDVRYHLSNGEEIGIFGHEVLIGDLDRFGNGLVVIQAVIT